MNAVGQIASMMTRNLYIGFDADAAIAALATGDPVANCQRRIDFIFARGFGGREALRGVERLIGIERWERRMGPYGLIWPSDHAGLVGLFSTHQQ